MVMNLAKVTAQFAKLSSEKMLRVEKGSFIQLGNEMEFKSPVDTAEFKDSWIGAIGSPSTETFSPGRSAVSALAVMLSGFRTGQVFYYTNSTPQAIPIEFGHSEQAANGVVRLTARRWPKIVNENIKANK
jgi:hypothetical protein